nr:MAG TPA: hypothetical protein [Caudoviricetes sp.]
MILFTTFTSFRLHLTTRAKGSQKEGYLRKV